MLQDIFVLKKAYEDLLSEYEAKEKEITSKGQAALEAKEKAGALQEKAADSAEKASLLLYASYNEIQQSNHLNRISRLDLAEREKCTDAHEEGSVSLENCYKTLANAQFGKVTGEDCSAEGSKCDSGLDLCCGQATPKDAATSKETNESLKTDGKLICD